MPAGIVRACFPGPRRGSMESSGPRRRTFTTRISNAYDDALQRPTRVCREARLGCHAGNIPGDPNVRPLPTIVRAGRSRVSSQRRFSNSSRQCSNDPVAREDPPWLLHTRCVAFLFEPREGSLEQCGIRHRTLAVFDLTQIGHTKAQGLRELLHRQPERQAPRANVLWCHFSQRPISTSILRAPIRSTFPRGRCEHETHPPRSLQAFVPADRRADVSSLTSSARGRRETALEEGGVKQCVSSP